MPWTAPRWISLALALATGACFSGTFLAGQPCTSDAECGPNLSCEEGRCGGATGAASSMTTSTSTTAPPTTTSTATTAPTPDSTSTSTSTSTSSTTAAETTGTSTTGDVCGIGRCTDVDLLIIIDDSPSMGDKSDTLLAMMLSFINNGLPTLSQACSIPEECRQLGALVRTDNNGDLCPFEEGHPYATAADLSMPASLACIATVGSDGSPDERPFDALLEVFDSQINSGCNDGFLRSDAFLVVIIATEKEDKSLLGASAHRYQGFLRDRTKIEPRSNQILGDHSRASGWWDVARV